MQWIGLDRVQEVGEERQEDVQPLRHATRAPGKVHDDDALGGHPGQAADQLGRAGSAGQGDDHRRPRRRAWPS